MDSYIHGIPTSDMEYEQPAVVIEDVSAQLDMFSNVINPSNIDQVASNTETRLVERADVKNELISGITLLHGGESGNPNSSESSAVKQTESSFKNAIRSCQVLQQTGQVFQQSGQVLPQSGQVLPQSGEVLQQTHQVLQQSGQQSGQVFQQSGQVLQQSGQVLQQNEDGATKENIVMTVQQDTDNGDVMVTGGEETTATKSRIPDWYKELEHLCKRIEVGGSECSVLFLDRRGGNKSFLHPIGTTKGKQFLDTRKYIIEEFLIHCSGLGVKEVLSPNKCSEKKTQSGEHGDDDNGDGDDDKLDDFIDDYEGNSVPDDASIQNSKVSGSKGSKKESPTPLNHKDGKNGKKESVGPVSVPESTLKMNLRKRKLKIEGEPTIKKEIKDIESLRTTKNTGKTSLSKRKKGKDGSQRVVRSKTDASKSLGKVKIDFKKNAQKVNVKIKEEKGEMECKKNVKKIKEEADVEKGKKDEGLKEETLSKEAKQENDLSKESGNFQELSTESQQNVNSDDVEDYSICSTEETIFKCYTCKVCFLDEKGLENHMKLSKHTGNEVNFKDKERSYVPVKSLNTNSKRQTWFRCTYCRLEMSSEENAKRHLNKATCIPFFQLTCRTCKVRFFKYNNYQMHIRKEGHFRRYDDIIEDEVPVKSETFYRCYTCDQYYTSLESLRRHMQATKHSGDKERDGKREMVIVTRKNVQKYKCTLCGIVFKTEESCKAHITKASCFREYKRLCQLCNVNIYEGFNIYSAHMQEIHNQDDPFAVVRIPKLTNNKKKKTTDFICEQCGKAYQTKWHLDYHVKYNHRDKSITDPDCVCDICNKILQTPHCKNVHMRDFHTNEKPFCCELCGYRAKTKGTLKYHYITHHTKDRPFTCDECNATFQTKQKWQRHKAKHALDRGCEEEATKHSKLYTCKECGKKFLHKTQCESHNLTHYNIGIQCGLCKSQFKNRRSIIRHYRKIHKYADDDMDELVQSIPHDKDLLKLKKEYNESDQNFMAEKEIPEETEIVEHTLILTVQEDGTEHEEIETATDIVEQII